MNKGKQCTVEPIRRRQDIQAVKDILKSKPRDLTLFTVGIHAGLRGSDLLALRWCDVVLDTGGIKTVIEVNEAKTGKLRRIAVSPNMRQAITDWLDSANDPKATCDVCHATCDDLLFPNGDGEPMSIQRLHQLVNEWTSQAGIDGHFGSHSLRKTYGYHLRKRGVDLPTLMKIFGHSSQSITLRYLGIDNDEIDEANLRLNL